MSNEEFLAQIASEAARRGLHDVMVAAVEEMLPKEQREQLQADALGVAMASLGIHAPEVTK